MQFTTNKNETYFSDLEIHAIKLSEMELAYVFYDTARDRFDLRYNFTEGNDSYRLAVDTLEQAIDLAMVNVTNELKTILGSV